MEHRGHVGAARLKLDHYPALPVQGTSQFEKPLPAFRRKIEGVVGPVRIEKRAVVRDGTTVLDGLADGLLDEPPFRGDGNVDLNLRGVHFCRGPDGWHVKLYPSRRYLVATAAPPAVDGQSLLPHKQGQATLQGAARRFDLEGLPDVFDGGPSGKTGNRLQDSVEFSLGDPFWHC